MLRSNLFRGLAVACMIVFGSSVGAQADDDQFNELFGGIFKTPDSTSSTRRYDQDFNFDYPYYSKRPKGKNTLTAKVDLSEQRMRIYINDAFWQEWKVSSGARGYRTPTGKYKPTRMHKMWYSRTYNNTPMPHSVFFHYGYAIHATLHVRGLGRPRSHGCVRLHPKHAKKFFELVQNFGRHKTNIVITK